MKTCRICGITKETPEFERGRAICKICRSAQNAEFYQKNKVEICLDKKEYRKANKEMISEKAKETYQQNKELILAEKKIYYQDNKEAVSDRMSKYYEFNKDIIKVSKAEYAKNNSDKISCRNAKRRATLLQACPQWLSIKQLRKIEAFYRLAKYLTKKSSLPYEVDHVIPLKGKNVSGLHAPWNLQILTRHKNRQKSNKAGK